MILIRLLYLMVILLTSPIWAPHLHSGIEYLMVEKPADCYSSVSTTIFGYTFPQACGNWVHYEKAKVK